MALIYGDARLLLPDLETGSVQCVITSPPYYSARRYGADQAELGWGSLDDYLADLGVILDECHRILDTEGTAWWVLGDKASGSGGAGGDHNRGGSKHWIPGYGKENSGLNIGWLLVPYRFARMAQQRGWLLRSMIVWDKTPTMRPEDMNHANRPLVSTERIVLLAKQVRHRWHPKRLVERADVWHVPPRRERGAVRHYAPFPEELPRRMMLAATSRGDHVVDPFAGCGTTCDVAKALGRRSTGFELYPPNEVVG